MDLEQLRKLLNIISNQDPKELIGYVDSMLGESNRIGVEFGKCIGEVNPSTTTYNHIFDMGFEKGIRVTKEQHGIKD
jgi:hypothetical protein